ncbi:MAG TPA: methionyl-tRNA formyltransferase [Ferruginibacter sp.]|nr:methionyl-tRNA formyltransferase [Ferruginibacter sp.]
MHVAVFGEDIFTSAVIGSLIENGHKVSIIVTPDYPNKKDKVLDEAAKKYNIELVKDENVNSENVKKHLERIKPDLIVSAHLRKILDKEIFSQAARGAINIHPSLLPKYRGLSPQHQAIIHGDDEWGVTVHYIDADVDTGEIIVQQKFPLAENEYILSVQTKMLAIYKKIVVEAIRLLEDTSFIPARQDLTFVSYFGPLKKSDREIRLSGSKQQVYNLVRAVSLPYKGAFYKNYTIWAAEIADPTSENELKEKYPDTGFYFDEAADEVIIHLEDGFVLSDDFEIN